MKNKGQTLLEVIIATGILSLALVAIIGVVVQSLVAGAESKQRTQATFLAQDAIEKIIAIRNVNAKAIKAGQVVAWDQDFYDNTVGKQDGYYSYGEYAGVGLPLQFKWLSATQIRDDYSFDLHELDGVKFIRYIQIKKYNSSTDQREINVRVTWPASKGTGEVYISTVITKLP